MKKAVRSNEEDQLEYDFELLEIAGNYTEMAMLALSPKKLTATIEDWAKAHIDYDPDEQQSTVIVAMAADACLFMPSMSGSTQMDRFIASAKTDDPMSRQALKALSRSEVRWVRITKRLDPDLVELEDRVSGERLVFIDSACSEAAEGLESLMRLCRLESGRYIHINSSFVLTAGLQDIVQGYVRPGKGIGNPYRCLAAVYKHAVREGVIVMPQRDFIDMDSAHGEEIQAAATIAVLNQEWLDAKKDPDRLQSLKADLRGEANAELLLSCLHFYGFALEEKLAEEAENFREICSVLAETLVRQQRFGMMHADEQLRFVKQSVSDGMREGNLDKRCGPFLDNLLASYGFGAASGAGDPELDKVIQRIRALRAKTIDQGCTEEEAIAAAEKAAELLDRYGLDLTETSMREIGCEAVRYNTGRKRRNETDMLCMVVSRFFDCKGWLTKTIEGEIQHVMFGFKADAEAAVLLIERIYHIIGNATEQFKKSGGVYNALSGARKRTAAASFQTGMVHGIAQKLNQLKGERVAHNSGNTGTALVVVKEDMIQEEMDKLGLAMRRLPDGEAMIHAESFHAGQQTGLTFSPEDHLE